MATNFRMQRINKFIKEEVTKIIRDKVSNPHISTWVSITRVNTSKDLGQSRILISIMDEKQEKQASIDALNHSKGYIRQELRKVMHTKKIPELLFDLDLTQDNVDSINALLSKIEQEEHPDDGTQKEPDSTD